MTEAYKIIIKALNETNAPYNNKLTVALELNRTKANFIKMATQLGIFSFLLDHIGTENQLLNDWCYAFGLTVYDWEETLFEIDLEIAAEEGLPDLAIKHNFSFELSARPENANPIYTLFGTKSSLIAYLENCYGENEDFFYENATEIE